MQLFSQPPIKNFQPTVIPQDVPVYRIKEGKFYADDELYEAGSIIAWNETPNLEMEPLNPLANEAMREFLKDLDVKGKEVAAKNGKAYISYADAFENSVAFAKNEGKRAVLLNGREEVPIMGGKKRGPRKAQKIDLGSDQKQVGTSGKLSIDGRKAVNASSDTGLE